jgi:hypothetical protein
VEAAGPPIATRAEAVARLPYLEPYVLVQLTAGQATAIAARSAEHAQAERAAPDPRDARYHRLHGATILGAEPSRWPAAGGAVLVPASWTYGLGGYAALADAPVLAEPGLPLVGWLE